MLLEIQNTNNVQNDETSRKPSMNTRSPLPPLLPLPCMSELSNGLDIGRISGTRRLPTPTKRFGEKRKRCESDDDSSEESQENKRPNSTNSSFSRTSASPEQSDLENTPTFHRRKARTAFTSFQIETLNNAYHENKYQATADRRDLARKLELTEQQIKNWFQNRRVKDKRNEKEDLLRRGGHHSGMDLTRMPMFTPPFSPHFMPQQLVPRLLGPISPPTPNNTLLSSAMTSTSRSPNSPSDKVNEAPKQQMPLPFPTVPHFFPGYPFMPGFPYPSPLMTGFPYPPFLNSSQFGHMPAASVYPSMNFNISNE